METAGARRAGDVRVDGWEVVAEGVIRVSLPYPNGYVNAFVFPHAGGFDMLDTGFDHPSSAEQLERALAAHGLAVPSLRTLAISHGHPDHVGRAPALQAASGAVAVAAAKEVDPAGFTRWWYPDLGWLAANGAPAGDPRPVVRELERLVVLGDGDRVELGGRSLEVIITPGHSPGLACLYDRERHILYSSDQLLHGLTPIARWSPAMADPLGEYLAGLDRLAELEVDLVLPGHGRPAGDFAAMLGAARARQAARLEEVARAYAAGATTAGAIVESLDWKVGPRFPAVFAVARALAYMTRLGLPIIDLPLA